MGRFNFENYYQRLDKKRKEEDNSMENVRNTEIKKDVKDAKKSDMDLHSEMNLLEARIYGMLNPYLKKIKFIDKNVEKLTLDKTISAAVKELKKKGYEFENEDEILEGMEVNYLEGLGFKLNKKVEDAK